MGSGSPELPSHDCWELLLEREKEAPGVPSLKGTEQLGNRKLAHPASERAELPVPAGSGTEGASSTPLGGVQPSACMDGWLCPSLGSKGERGPGAVRRLKRLGILEVRVTA